LLRVIRVKKVMLRVRRPAKNRIDAALLRVLRALRAEKKVGQKLLSIYERTHTIKRVRGE
jgi:hypothetical protein